MSTTPENFQLMPNAPDSEVGLLCSWLLDPRLIDEFAWVREEDFYQLPHQILCRILRDMWAAQKPVDIVTVTQQASDLGKLEEIGGVGRMADIATFLPTASNADYYAKIVKEKAVRRSIIQATNKLQRKAYSDHETSVEELMQEAEAVFLALRNETQHEHAVRHYRKGLKAALDQIESVYKHRGQPIGLATGLLDLDRMTGGLREAQLVVLAGRPGMGKTAMGLQWAAEFSKQVPVMFFSLEMNESELCSRLICSETKINLARVRDGFLERADMPRMMQAVGTLLPRSFYLDDTPQLSIFEFRSRARRAVVQHGVKAIFVDYLQLMRCPNRRGQESRALEVGEVSMALKAAAKELKIPVIAMAQLNRDAEGRNSPPKLADLRESGQIEQDADIVAMLHRPKKDSDDEAERTQCDLHIVKHRDGPPGVVNLRFLGEFYRFENVTKKLYSNNNDERQK